VTALLAPCTGTEGYDQHRGQIASAARPVGSGLSEVRGIDMRI